MRSEVVVSISGAATAALSAELLERIEFWRQEKGGPMSQPWAPARNESVYGKVEL
jgi:hypothetical protein